MKRTLILAASWVACVTATHAAPPDDAKLARYRQASACVAVMKQDVVGLVSRSRAGTPNLRPEMVRLTELGFAFIGTAYKSGLRNPQADQLLEEAEAAQKRQSPESLRQLSVQCQAEGSKLLRDSNALERALVSNRAKARVDKLLAPDRQG